MMQAHLASSQRTGRLFATCFAALVATSFCFVLRAFVIDDWGREFRLSETQKGELLGVGLWPFAISIVLLSLVIDRVGYRAALWFAVICHTCGTGLLLVASGYWSLYVGTFMLALGSGAVEAAINPAIASAFPDNKTTWLNRLHAGWPAGLVLGGLLALAQGPSVDWHYKIVLVAVPALIYGFMLVGCRFPVSERVGLGVSYREMLGQAGVLSAVIVVSLMVLELGRVFGLPLSMQIVIIVVLTAIYAFYARSLGRPLFILMVLTMIPLATTELGTDSWITSLMEPAMTQIGLQPGWVLIYTSALMVVLRLLAGPLVHRLSPLGLLAAGSAIAAVGLLALSRSTGIALLGAATLYGIGKSFFWPTTLGLVSEQFPKGGALTLNVVSGAGMLAVGIVGSVLLGTIQDVEISRSLTAHDNSQGTELGEQYLTQEKTSIFGRYRALDSGQVEASEPSTRAAINSVVLVSKQKALWTVAALPVIMLAIYLSLILYFRSQGGYRPVNLSRGDTTDADPLESEGQRESHS